MSISQMLLPEFDEEMKNTRKVLERIPEDKFDYKPHEKSMPLGRLTGHVAELPSWAKCTFEVDVLDIPADYKPWEPKSKKEILDKFDGYVKEAREWLSKTPDEAFSETWTLKWGGNVLLQQPRAAVYRGMVMNHLIHHRAQLGVYLRLNNIAVPGMYGPSADEMEMANATSQSA